MRLRCFRIFLAIPIHSRRLFSATQRQRVNPRGSKHVVPQIITLIDKPTPSALSAPQKQSILNLHFPFGDQASPIFNRFILLSVSEEPKSGGLEKATWLDSTKTLFFTVLPIRNKEFFLLPLYREERVTRRLRVVRCPTWEFSLKSLDKICI